MEKNKALATENNDRIEDSEESEVSEESAESKESVNIFKQSEESSLADDYNVDDNESKYNPENIQATPTIETSQLVTTDSSQPPDVSTCSILSVSDVVEVGSMDASPAVPYGHLSPSVQTRLSNVKTEPAGEPYGALSASVQFLPSLLLMRLLSSSLE